MPNANIVGARKVAWDQLWHLLYIKDGRITYDRMSKAKAIRLASQATELVVMPKNLKSYAV